MNTEQLKFNEIKSGRHTAYGVLTDDDGNTFSIEVKGTNKAAVEDFVKYELRQANQGVGITTELNPAEEQAETDVPTNDELHEQTSWRGISVKVKLLELKNKIDKPNIIRFTIDPPIKEGKSMDFPVDLQEKADVLCTVATGKVSVELFEFTDSLKTTSTLRETKPASPGKPAPFHVHQSKTEGTSDWNIRVLGELSSTFTLTLDLKVT